VILLAFALVVPCRIIVCAAQHSSTPPSFARDIQPILRNSCVACHDSELSSGGIRLDTFEGLMKGGENGPAVVPGKSAESRMVLMIEGKIKPEMPMGGGPLMADEIAAIKAWIDAGARNSDAETPSPSPKSRPAVPEIKPQSSVLAQVSSVAFNPRGSILAVAGYKEVKLLDPAKSQSGRSLTGATDVVRALAYSYDGRYLAAGGGAPARYGEALVWDADGRLTQTLRGHSDFVYSVAFSRDGRLIATSSYDRLIKLWDAETGREIRTLKDHIDAVYPIEFSPDGKLLASGSADRTVKVWEVETGRRLFTLSDALDAIYALSFHPSGKKISAAGADKYIRVWELSADGGVLTNSTIAHEDAIIALKYSPDGKTLVSTGQDRRVKLWDADKNVEIKVLERQSDWPLAVAFSPDSRKLAVGRYDGSVSLYDVMSGARLDLIQPPTNESRRDGRQ
jgi:Tol biopolymer transport system component